MAIPKTIYQQVVDISIEYLGPSAERFINRQITTHLQKNPEKLNKRDIPRLTEWVRVTFALLTDDQELVEAFVGDLRSLSTKPSKTTQVPDAQSK